MGKETQPTADEQVRKLFGDAEKGTATASAVEQLVHSDSFGEILARVTQNVMGLTKIGFDVLDLTVRNLRLAGRPDITRLGRQLARNEDKLERVLQEVESLQEQVGKVEQSSSSSRRRSASQSSNGGSSNAGSRRSKSKSKAS